MIPIRFIQQATADHYDIKVSDIKGPSRKRVFAWPRHVAMLLSRRHNPNKSFPEIARSFGNRDHTTIMGGCTATIERMDAELEHDCHTITKVAAKLWDAAIRQRDAELDRNAYNDFTAHQDKQEATQ
jgi:chromosomal replication initiation ATPase DnaA